MKCKTKYCRNAPKKGRTCSTCHTREYRKNNPYRYSYNNLKSNAKRRGKEFNLTFEEFKEFSIKTNYLIGKGRSKDSYTIDRIDTEKGYSIDNIQILSNSENVRKHLKWTEDRNGKPCNFHFKSELKLDGEGLPF